MDSFRDELFKLIREIEQSDLKKEIIQIRKNMMNENPKIFEKKSLLFSGSKETINHFYGILLINSELEKGNIQDNLFKQLDSLDIEEKVIFTKGHQLMTEIFNRLRLQLNFLPLPYQIVLNPYSNLKPFKLEGEFSKEVELDQFQNFFDSFKTMSLVEKIEKKYKKNEHHLNRATFDDVSIMIEKIDEEISECGFKNSPSTMTKISMKRLYNNLNSEETMLDFFYSLFILKQSVRLVLNTVFSVLIGKKLSVINEDNIINIGGEFSDGLKKGEEFLLVNNEKTFINVGNLVLINYEIKKQNIKVHEFGMIYQAQWRNISNDGRTIKCSVLKIDECLNPYFNYDKY